MIGLIVAYAKNRAIGNKGTIPWNIEGEQARFRELTTGNIIVMGRKTYEDIGRPLPNRINIVVSSTKKFMGEDFFTVTSLAEALAFAKELDEREGVERDIFLSGGHGIYKEGLPLCEVLYITEVDLEPEGDAFFPEFDESLYEKTIESLVDGPIPYAYVKYVRK